MVHYIGGRERGHLLGMSSYKDPNPGYDRLYVIVPSTCRSNRFLLRLGLVSVKHNEENGNTCDQSHISIYAIEHITRWRHQMETFSTLLAICAGNSPVNSPHKAQWRGALMFSLICVWINGWANIREVGDLRRYRAQYDVIVVNEMGFFCQNTHNIQFISRPWCNHSTAFTKYVFIGGVSYYRSP